MNAKTAQIAENGQTHLKNVPAQVLVFHDLCQLLPHIRSIDLNVLLLKIRTVERDVFEQLLHDRVKTPRPDIFGVFVHLRRDPRDLRQGVIGETELYAFSLKESGVLLHQCRLRLFQDPNEIAFAKRFQFNANRETSL